MLRHPHPTCPHCPYLSSDLPRRCHLPTFSASSPSSPKEVAQLNQDQIVDIVCRALAGPASEETFLASIGTGALDDQCPVTQVVHSAIQLPGMNEWMNEWMNEGGNTGVWNPWPWTKKPGRSPTVPANAPSTCYCLKLRKLPNSCWRRKQSITMRFAAWMVLGPPRDIRIVKHAFHGARQGKSRRERNRGGRWECHRWCQCCH